MSTTLLWFSSVIGYVIQTKCLSNIQSRKSIPVGANGSIATPEANSDNGNSSSLTFYLTFMYFASWLLLVPASRLWKSMRPMFASDSDSNRNPQCDGANAESVTDEDVDTFSHVLDDPPRITIQQQKQKIVSVATFKYLAKLTVLALIMIIANLTYNMALSLSPAFDVALIQNTAIFEIVTLLYGVCGISRKNYVFRNFLIMMNAVIGILIISYTKATCDMLAGKLSVNPNTGELSDPFLFDRLKGALICGLGALIMGPFAVLWNRWFCSNISKNEDSAVVLVKQTTHLALIGIIGMVILLPFIPKFPSSVSLDAVSLLYNDKSFWLSLLGSIFFGSLPNLISVLELNRKAPAEYLTTCNLGAIIFMGLAEWICEPTQTTIVRWEVIGYIMLTVSLLVLSVTLGEGKYHR
ncbi:csg2p [Saccharomyces arboricola H-6]|uniref:Csg2p n=1 Tax=Saccharomyces arboricola (strain H-6 / AS 2.3317 / CBS 10644) TaxID=1160507 RepID=J8Q548_SACAR|nr:csg2p [Saccharomyces arboricola H-6]